jgi:hypothetical protein
MTYKQLFGLGLAVSLLLCGGRFFVEEANATHPVQLCPVPVSVCTPSPTMEGDPTPDTSIEPSPGLCR